MNDELMRKISDAIDSEDGLAGDPELIALMAKTPEASRYAKHLSRMQRWVAAWPVREPSEAEFEAMAKAIDARLGDKFSGDFTRAPDFEEDEEFARVSSAILQAADVESEPEHPMGDTSDALELTMSAITELADQVNEEASAVPLGRVPLKRGAGGIDPVVPQLATATLIDDLPAALPKAKPVVGLPKVPSPRAGAATVIGNPSGKADARDDAPAARIDADRGAPPAIKPAVPKPTESKAEKPVALEPKPIALEAKAPPKPPEKSAADKPAVERPAPPVPATTEKATTEKAIAKDAKPPKPPEAKPAAKPESKSASKTTERVSIPVPSPSANAPRLELIEGGRSKAPPPPQEQRRGWLPAVLAAAAIAIGVIGVGSMMTSGGAAPSPETATATGAVTPTRSSTAEPMPAALAVQAPAPAEAPEYEASEGAIAATTPTPAPAPPPATVAPAVAASGGASQGASIGGEGRGFGGAGGGGTGTGAGTLARAARPGARGGAARAASADDGAGAVSEPAVATAPARRTTAEDEPGAGGAQGRSAPATPAATTTSPHHTEAASAPVGETLDRATVQSVMASVEPAVRACAGERHGTAAVDVVVQGSGRVTSATVTGNFQGSTEGSCIARAVRGARFPAFTGEALRFRYPFGI